MNRTNYFMPYEKGGNAKHEDHLSRAFLALVRLSPIVQISFYHLIKESLLNLEYKDIRPYWDLDNQGTEIFTQVSSLPEAQKYVSVLLTDEPIDAREIQILPSERKACYDGILKLGSTVFFIENKPSHKNVRKEQLNPAKHHIPADDNGETGLVGVPAIIEWKTIFDLLYKIAELPTTTYPEKLLIDDFFQYSNQFYTWLNPYDRFAKCKGDHYLIRKRIQQILTQIAFSPELVQSHSGWSDYIALEYEEVKKLAIRLHYNSSQDWNISVVCDFGSTGWQAKHFYDRLKKWEVLQELKNVGWDVSANFHLAVQQDNILFFGTEEKETERYFNYWAANWNQRQGVQVQKDKLISLLESLAQQKLIVLDEEKRFELQKHLEKRYQKFNICPALVISYYFKSPYCIENDQTDTLVNEIKQKMKDVLSILGHSTAAIIKQ